MKRVYSILFFSLVFFNCMAQRSMQKGNLVQGPDVAVQFINDYVSFCSQQVDSENNWIAENKLLTDNFKASYIKLIESAFKEDPELGLGFDPILDAQDYPDQGFKLLRYDHDTGFVTLEGKDWADFILVLKVVKQKGKWLVDGAGVINIPENKRGKR